MTVNNTIPFMAKKKVEKRKFIEGIFNLEIFSNMISNLRNDYNETKKDFDIESTRYDENNTTLENFKKQKDNLLEERKKKVTKYKNRQEDNQRALLDIRSKLTTIENDVIEQNELLIEKIENKIQELSGKKSKRHSAIEGIKGVI